MRRRTFLAAGLAAAAVPQAARAQAALSLTPIEPANELERAFLAAFEDPTARATFRQELLGARVALALANSAPDSAPRIVPLPNNRQGGAIFTSAARLSNIFGPAAPRVLLTGRDALERLRGQHVALNYRLMPMLTLEPEDVAEYLEE